MPINVSSYIRMSPTDDSFGVPPPPPVVVGQASAVLLTQRGERFTGYHLIHDADGNTLLFMKPGAWLNQPGDWSRRSVTNAIYDLRAP